MQFLTLPAKPRILLGAVVACAALLSQTAVMAADSAASQISGWTQQARTTNPAFEPSAARGAQIYNQVHATTPNVQSCAACHGESPSATGKHVITSKLIQPLAPAANAERFTDAAKTEKWFKRNCNEVTGRECTPAMKADFVTWLIKGSKQ